MNSYLLDLKKKSHQGSLRERGLSLMVDEEMATSPFQKSILCPMNQSIAKNWDSQFQCACMHGKNLCGSSKSMMAGDH